MSSATHQTIEFVVKARPGDVDAEDPNPNLKHFPELAHLLHMADFEIPDGRPDLDEIISFLETERQYFANHPGTLFVR